MTPLHHRRAVDELRASGQHGELPEAFHDVGGDRDNSGCPTGTGAESSPARAPRRAPSRFRDSRTPERIRKLRCWRGRHRMMRLIEDRDPDDQPQSTAGLDHPRSRSCGTFVIAADTRAVQGFGAFRLGESCRGRLMACKSSGPRPCWVSPAAPLLPADRTGRATRRTEGARNFGLVAEIPAQHKILARAWEWPRDSPETPPWYALHAPYADEYLRRQMHDLLGLRSRVEDVGADRKNPRRVGWGPRPSRRNAGRRPRSICRILRVCFGD